MIAHFLSQLPGGAGLAAQRLHLALCRAGVLSRMFYGSGEAVDASMQPVFQNRSFFWRNAEALANSWRGRRTVADGFVTSPRWVRQTRLVATGLSPELINLHWVARWLDLPSFFGSLPMGLPVVWTVHDLIPITGGCHYPGECDGFTQQCGNCPQQKKPHPQDATRKFFRLKAEWYRKLNLHFVGNSEWTTAQIRRSGLAAHARSIHTIPLGLDTGQFMPVEKSCARKALGIPKNRMVIGFACADLTEARKGAQGLLEAFKSLPGAEIFLVTFGAGRWPQTMGVDTLQLGGINSPRLQSLFYSALDVFVTPSRAETFGNTAMEAMACETPVVAYATSGLRDVVVDGETGLLGREIGSVSGLAGMLRWMLVHPAERLRMGLAGRQRVIQNFSDHLMAERYQSLYESLVRGDKL
jgi:glycosyltransferase involved in cell wall biosynthesis